MSIYDKKFIDKLDTMPFNIKTQVTNALKYAVPPPMKFFSNGLYKTALVYKPPKKEKFNELEEITTNNLVDKVRHFNTQYHENMEEYKELKEENEFFSKSYQITKKQFEESQRNRKGLMGANLTFSDLITKYKNMNYKIPDLTVKRNLFEPSPLLMEDNKILNYYKGKIGIKKEMQDKDSFFLENLNYIFVEKLADSEEGLRLAKEQKKLMKKKAQKQKSKKRVVDDVFTEKEKLEQDISDLRKYIIKKEEKAKEYKPPKTVNTNGLITERMDKASPRVTLMYSDRKAITRNNIKKFSLIANYTNNSLENKRTVDTIPYIDTTATINYYTIDSIQEIERSESIKDLNKKNRSYDVESNEAEKDEENDDYSNDNDANTPKITRKSLFIRKPKKTVFSTVAFNNNGFSRYPSIIDTATKSTANSRKPTTNIHIQGDLAIQDKDSDTSIINTDRSVLNSIALVNLNTNSKSKTRGTKTNFTVLSKAPILKVIRETKEMTEVKRQKQLETLYEKASSKVLASNMKDDIVNYFVNNKKKDKKQLEETKYNTKYN